MCNWSHQVQGRDTTFIMGHAHLKKAILLLKRANMPFFLSICVSSQGYPTNTKGIYVLQGWKVSVQEQEKSKANFSFRRENFSFRDRRLSGRAQRGQTVDRGMESLTEEWKVSLRFFHIPGPLTFQPYRCIFSICGASTNHKTSTDCRCYLWMPPNLDVVYGCPQQPLAQSKLTCI